MPITNPRQLLPYEVRWSADWTITQTDWLYPTDKGGCVECLLSWDTGKEFGGRVVFIPLMGRCVLYTNLEDVP